MTRIGTWKTRDLKLSVTFQTDSEDCLILSKF